MPLEDKTEAATPERRKDARKKGQVAKSVELTSAITLFTGLMVSRSVVPGATGQLSELMTQRLSHLSSFDPTPEGAQALFLAVSLSFIKVVGPILGGILLAGLSANVAQVGLFASGHALAPDFSRLDPMKGVARLFSPRAGMELAKSLFKVGIIGSVVWAYLKGEQNTVLALGTMDQKVAGHVAGEMIWKLSLRAAGVMLAIAAVDYAFQRAQFEKSIKMTKQEVKEEFKRSEGDPVIKAQFRSRHRQLASKRMMQDVPKADVIVTNPTHYAVALKYDSATMAAPIVLAKGQRLVAQRIKEIARQNHIPLVENKPVARALFASAKIGSPIPVDLYQAVAEILAFVYKLKHGTGNHLR